VHFFPSVWRKEQVSSASYDIRMVKEPDSAKDRNTRREFTDEELHMLSKLRKELGAVPERRLVGEWFKKNAGRGYGPEWIVKNRFIVKKNDEARARGAVCVLDPDLMPSVPFPRVVDRRKK
jgi:hypothetical protein